MKFFLVNLSEILHSEASSGDVSKKVFLKILRYSQENNSVGVSFLKNLCERLLLYSTKSVPLHRNFAKCSPLFVSPNPKQQQLK